MDTLFRLVSLQSSDQQQSSFNSRSTTSSTSRSSRAHHHHHPSSSNYYHPSSSYYGDQEECCNGHRLFMDEDDLSSSSSRRFFPPPPPPSSSSAPPHSLFDPADFSSSSFSPPASNLDLDFAAAAQGARWAGDLLLECARAVAARDSSRVQRLMWMLNELASPYGDTEQKLASYFLQALFARLTSSGPRTLATLASASDRAASFDSMRRTALRFQELSPWSPFGHVAANGAILEAFLEGSPTRLHILDLSTTFCTQWPTLLEALATRSSADDTPHLSITTVVPSASPSAAASRVMKEVGARMERFARLMGVPFRFHAVHHEGDLSALDLDSLDLRRADEALAVNCIGSLRGVPPSGRRRDSLLVAIRRLRPRVVTVVEEEADLVPAGLDDDEAFMKVFREGLRFFSAYFDSLEESFPRTSNERLVLERAVGRAAVDLVSCPSAESAERRETAAGWSRRMRAAGFSPTAFSDDVADDVRALLRRYREGWSMRTAADDGDDSPAAPTGIFLAWKDQPVVWASAWRP